ALTNDACMNIFTQSQKDRMQVVLTNSPRRASLVGSKGATPPVVVSNDAGIMAIKTPQVTSCSVDLIPEVSIRNYGNNQLASATVALSVDGVIFDTRTPDLNLDPLAIAQVSFESFSITPGSNHNFEFRITQANGVADENADNDVQSEIVSLSQTTPLPIATDFASFPNQWAISNPDNVTTWTLKTAPNQNVSNQAIYMNFFDYENGIGDYDFLLSPTIDLSQYSSAQISFEVAYTTFSGGSNDGLIVAVSTDCGNTFLRADYLFEKYGADLATAPTTGASFTPSDRTQWSDETLDLGSFLTSSEVQIAFIGVNDFGNNLYLDNIQITGVLKTGLDLAVARVVQPGIVSCENSFTPVVRVKNEGVNTISSFQVSYQLGLDTPVTIDYSGPALQPGEETDVTFEEITTGNGSSNILASIANPNGETQDDNTDNDTRNLSFLIDQDTELVPVREDFTNFTQINWSIINTDAAKTWEAASLTNGNVAAFINNFNYEEKGQLDFLVSPVLDFTESDSARLSFRVSYASGNNFNDGLLVLATQDCGVEFTDTLFQKFGSDLAVNQSTSAWVPTEEEDWITEIINLNEYAGLENVRIAFVAVNDFGNNLYIDDIQFFNSNSTASLALEAENMVIFPNPAGDTFQVSFNLAEREELVLTMVDATGRVLFQRPLANTLNQTYEFDLPQLAQGMYILQAKGPTFQQSKRLIISK
ncbi:MAG: choice-of-anchor J domain-containing protein, partial [Cyclobacteriaceae bacterium]